MKMNGKTAAATMSAVALIGASAMPLAAVAAPAVDAPESAAPAAVQVGENAAANNGTVRSDHVEGTFSFDQGAVTPTTEIASVFAKAAATLCQALPGYSCDAVAQHLMLSSNGNPVILATAQELAAQDGEAGFVMACACATNGPGGGAVVNAEVSGTSVATLAALADAA